MNMHQEEMSPSTMQTLEVWQWISIAIAVLCAATVGYFKYIARNDDYWKNRGIVYAPRMNLFTALKLVESKPLHMIIMDMSQKYGKVFGTFEGSKPGLSVGEPDLLKDILVKDFHIFPYRREFRFGDPKLDKILSLLTGEDWKRVRTIITPAFTSKRMRQMSSIINSCAKSVVEVFGRHTETDDPIDCRGAFTAYIMDVIASAAFGTKIDSHNDPNNEFLQQAKKGFIDFSIWKTIFFMLIPLRFLKYINFGVFASLDFFTSVTKAVIKKRKEKGELYKDVLQILMDASEEKSSVDNSEINVDEEDVYGSITNRESLPPLKYKRLSEDEVLAQCFLFFFVGYETSASVLSYTAYSLATNPECQEKVIKEIDDAFERHSEMSYDSIRDMKILDAVISETLRLYPSLIVSERTAVEDYKLGNTGIVVEKGMRVAFPIYAMHHDPDNFYDPEKFDPNRFLDPSKSKHHPYAYLPFGAGPRNCLGMRFALLEIKLCIVNLLRHYRLQPHSTTKIPLEFKKGSQFMSVNELPLTIRRRIQVQN